MHVVLWGVDWKNHRRILRKIFFGPSFFVPLCFGKLVVDRLIISTYLNYGTLFEICKHAMNVFELFFAGTAFIFTLCIGAYAARAEEPLEKYTIKDIILHTVLPHCLNDAAIVQHSSFPMTQEILKNIGGTDVPVFNKRDVSAKRSLYLHHKYGRLVQSLRKGMALVQYIVPNLIRIRTYNHK